MSYQFLNNAVLGCAGANLILLLVGVYLVIRDKARKAQVGLFSAVAVLSLILMGLSWKMTGGFNITMVLWAFDVVIGAYFAQFAYKELKGDAKDADAKAGDADTGKEIEKSDVCDAKDVPASAADDDKKTADKDDNTDMTQPSDDVADSDAVEHDDAPADDVKTDTATSTLERKDDTAAHDETGTAPGAGSISDAVPDDSKKDEKADSTSTDDVDVQDSEVKEK